MKILILSLCLICTLNAWAQNKAWLSASPDTTYNTLRDYRQNVKNFPFIKIVPDSPVLGVKEARNLIYSRIGTRELHLDAFTPAMKKSGVAKHPAVILIHGGGWRSGNRTQHIPLAQHLAVLGYPSFTVEYRLSTEAFYPSAIYDLKAAIRWIKANAAKYSVDPSKITVLGFSAGGELAAFMGVTSGNKKFDGDEGNNDQSSAVQAVIDIDGTLSFVSPDAWETQNAATVGASAWWIGFPRSERLDLWTEASPFTYAKNNRAPFLFLNSAIERMHAGRDEFKKIMDEKKVYVDIKNFPETPHSFCLYRPWFDPMVQDISVFLAKVFKVK